MANATIYLLEDDVDLRPLFRNVTTDKTTLAPATWFEFVLDGLPVRYNVMPTQEIPRHIEGFRRYISALDEEPQRKADATHALGGVKSVLGLIADGDFQKRPEVWASLFTISKAIGGYILVYDSFVLSNGGVVFGPLRHQSA